MLYLSLTLFLFLSNSVFSSADAFSIIPNPIQSKHTAIPDTLLALPSLGHEKEEVNTRTSTKTVINNNVLTIFIYNDNLVHVYESKLNKYVSSNQWQFFYLPVMLPVEIQNHDRWVTAIGNEVRLRIMLGNNKIEDLARQAIRRKFNDTINNETSQYWDIVPLMMKTLMTYVVQRSSLPVGVVEPYHVIHPNSLFLTFRFHCTTNEHANDVAEKLCNGIYEIEILSYFDGIHEVKENSLSITNDQLKSVLRKTTADGGNRNAIYIHRNQASKYIRRYIVNMKKMMYIENPNVNLSQMITDLSSQFMILFQQGNKS